MPLTMNATNGARTKSEVTRELANAYMGLYLRLQQLIQDPVQLAGVMQLLMSYRLALLELAGVVRKA